MVQERYFKPLQPDPAAFVGTIVGRYLNETRGPGTLVALNTAGSTPYFASSLRYIDMLGLLDPHIAHRDVPQTRLSLQRMSGHSKGDGQYVLERDPDIVIIGPAQGATANAPWFLTDLELSEDPRFHDRYRLRRTSIDVRAYRGYEHHAATREGAMALTYYERVRLSGVVSAH